MVVQLLGEQNSIICNMLVDIQVFLYALYLWECNSQENRLYCFGWQEKGAGQISNQGKGKKKIDETLTGSQLYEQSQSYGPDFGDDEEPILMPKKHI